MPDWIIDEVDAIECWHFLADDRRLGYEGREVVHAGSVISVSPPLQLCARGLHASIRAIDALNWAPGPVICRVRVWGEVVRGADKLCGQHRRVTWMADATEVLHRFACRVATDALDLVEAAGGKIDPRSRKAIAVKLAWLDGMATAEELADARLDALTGALAASRSAAVDAAAYHVIGISAWDAARDAAAMAAAGAAMAPASRYAAVDAARASQNRRLHDLLAQLNPAYADRNSGD